jgi:PAS domain S-box-containing protein
VADSRSLENPVDFDAFREVATQLRASQARLQSIIETAPECIKVISADGHIREMNVAGLAMLEAGTLAEVQDRPLSEFVASEHRAAFAALHRRVMSGGTGALEFEVVGLQGARRWLETRAVPLRGDAGDVQALLGITRDVTERRRTEERLRASEERFREITERIEEVFWITDPGKNEMLYVSPAYEKIWGRTCDSVYASPRDWLEAVHPGDRERLDDAVHTRQAAGTYDEEYRIVRPDGGVRWIHERAFPMRDAAGHVFRIVGVAEDVTGRKRNEEELRYSQEKFSKAFQSSPDSLVLSRVADSRIIEVNDVFVRLTGHSRAETIGRTTTELGVWADLQDRDRYLAALRGGSVREQPARFHMKGGTILDGLVSGEIIRLGEDLVALTTIRDVTDLKRAEEERRTLETQLLQSQKMEAIGRLAGGVAHDFNNMLGVILGYADIALRKLRPVDPLHRNLVAIRDAAQRSAELTRQLLAFSRQQVIAPRVIDLNDRLQGMERLLQRVIGEDVSLEFRLAPDTWPVSMDPSQVDQVLANLAVNSRDAMPDGGKLIVETANVRLDAAYSRRHSGARPGEYVMLTVSDTGSGMDEVTRERAFEPFFTTKPEGKGTGLGLATVYGAVKQNNGFIDIYSEPRQGTTIRLYIPRAGPDQTAPPEAVPAAAPARGQETVLVVEDQDQLREIAREMLEELGYTVLVAAGPADALRLCEGHGGEIHLLFTDVVMPQMNGKELAGRIQAMRPRVKALFTSGYTADTIAHRGVLEAGISFLEKPFSMDALARKVREVLAP